MLTKILEEIKAALKAFAVWVGILRESVNGSYKIRNRWLTTFFFIVLIGLNGFQFFNNEKRCADLQKKCDRNDSINKTIIDECNIKFYKEFEILREDYRKLRDEKLNRK